MAIDTLSVVNDCLALMGERPLNDLDIAHPLVARALGYLSSANTTVQAQRWWFNDEVLTLTPQVGGDHPGEILLPNDTLACDSLTQEPRLAVRDRRLYNLDEASYIFTSPLKVRLHREVPFDEAPVLARAYISLCAQLAFQNSFDGDINKTRNLERSKADAYIHMSAEHIRAVRANFLWNGSIGRKLIHIHGSRRYRW